jgi:hypothetical protein
MTRLRIASLFVAVVAGDYAALMLIDGQLNDFGVAAAICAGSSVVAGLIAYADDEDARRQHELGRRRRKALTRRRAAIWERRDQQAATATDQLCPLCGGARQKISASPRFVDRQGARLCGACRAGPQPNADTMSLRQASMPVPRGEQPERVRRGTARPRLGVTWDRFGWRGAPDDPGLEVLT